MTISSVTAKATATAAATTRRSALATAAPSCRSRRAAVSSLSPPPTAAFWGGTRRGAQPRLLHEQHPQQRRSESTRPERSSSSTDPTSSAAALLDGTNSLRDFFATLRWKAANALTSSLSTEERRQLIERIQPTPTQSTPAATSSTTSSSDATALRQSAASAERAERGVADDHGAIEHSIAEAVAKVRIEETQRFEHRWEQERAQLIRQAEEAARKRIESDLLIQQRRLKFEQWQQQVEREKQAQLQQQQSQQSQSQEQQQLTAAAASSPPAVEEAVAATPSEGVDRRDDRSLDHPILGRALYDFGYKRVYRVPASTLANIPVWKRQRIYRHARSRLMASDKLKTLHLGMPGIIALYEDSNGKLSILDGQHRVGMMTILQEKKAAINGDMIDLENILVEVFPYTYLDQLNKKTAQNDSTATKVMDDEKHATEIFEEVNKAEPIKLVDMPGVAKGSHRKILTEGASRVAEAFPEMFKPSQKCRSPHLNIDNLRDALFASDVLTRHKLETGKALEQWMMRQNEILEQKYASDEQARNNVPPTALEKAHKHKFYLGLESGWLYN